MDSKYLTHDEAVRMLNYSRSDLSRGIKLGQINKYKDGDSFRYSRAELQGYRDTNKLPKLPDGKGLKPRVIRFLEEHEGEWWDVADMAKYFNDKKASIVKSTARRLAKGHHRQTDSDRVPSPPVPGFEIYEDELAKSIKIRYVKPNSEAVSESYKQIAIEDLDSPTIEETKEKAEFDPPVLKEGEEFTLDLKTYKAQDLRSVFIKGFESLSGQTSIILEDVYAIGKFGSYLDHLKKVQQEILEGQEQAARDRHHLAVDLHEFRKEAAESSSQIKQAIADNWVMLQFLQDEWSGVGPSSYKSQVLPEAQDEKQ